MSTAREEQYAIASANRRLAADMFASLTPEQWLTPSLCAGWTVREVAAHLVPPEGGFTLWSVLRMMVRFRGDLDRMVDVTTRAEAELPTQEIVARLRARADVRLDAPVVGPGGPLTDTAIHLRDAARPLGLDVCPQPASWRPVLDFLVSRQATRGFLPRGRLTGLRLVTDDLEWSAGDGEEVSGPAEAVALAIAGRAVVVDELSGPGARRLADRIG